MTRGFATLTLLPLSQSDGRSALTPKPLWHSDGRSALTPGSQSNGRYGPHPRTLSQRERGGCMLLSHMLLSHIGVYYMLLYNIGLSYMIE